MLEIEVEFIRQQKKTGYQLKVATQQNEWLVTFIGRFTFYFRKQANMVHPRDFAGSGKGEMRFLILQGFIILALL